MILDKIREKFAAELLESHQDRGEFVAVIKKDRIHEILQQLRDDPELRFDFLMDLCGVDRRTLNEPSRFEVVYQLYSSIHNHRLRLRVKLAETDLQLPTSTDLWKTANWFERECWEMYGIVFVGHPNLKHLLLFDGFAGHPLRKDYPSAKRQSIPIPEEKPS